MSICDPKTFESIYHNWCEPIQRFLISRGAGHEESIDYMQESFLRLWKKCKDIGAEQAKSFLFTTSNRLLIDQYRKSQTEQKYISNLRVNANLQDGQYLAEMNEFRVHFEQALNTMTEASREVFMLHRFNDMTYAEIAEHIGIGIKAVEKRMHKALLHLKNQNIPKI